MATALIAVLWAGLTLYAVLGGADFGAGILHLFASRVHADRQREAIATAMGPVWEANHVWLIFVITGLFSAFPRAFSALGMVAFLPATLALVGIAVRGACFAFAGHADDHAKARRQFERLFGAASLATPLLFGAIAGGLARQRANGGLIGFWIGPFQLLVGMLAVALCTALAASFMTVEAHRAGNTPLAASFRSRGMWATTAAAGLAGAAMAVAPASAPSLFQGLVHRALPEVLVAMAAFAGGFAALRRRAYRLARVAVSLAVTAVVWGWGFAQYPRLVGPGFTLHNSAASAPELTAVTVALAAGFVLLVPSLAFLYVVFRRQPIEVTK